MSNQTYLFPLNLQVQNVRRKMHVSSVTYGVLVIIFIRLVFFFSPLFRFVVFLFIYFLNHPRKFHVRLLSRGRRHHGAGVAIRAISILNSMTVRVRMEQPAPSYRVSSSPHCEISKMRSNLEKSQVWTRALRCHFCQCVLYFCLCVCVRVYVPLRLRLCACVIICFIWFSRSLWQLLTLYYIKATVLVMAPDSNRVSFSSSRDRRAPISGEIIHFY